MHDTRLVIHKSEPLHGSETLIGAKNAALVMMASLILTKGTSILMNVPYSADIRNMMLLLQHLGAIVVYNEHNKILQIDTSCLTGHQVDKYMMSQMRASVLVMGPLLARFGRAHIALPGGCVIGERPINYHLSSFEKMGVKILQSGNQVLAVVDNIKPAKIILEYPSVGATENILMLAVQAKGTSKILNASLEPEVFDFIALLQKMGAKIQVTPPATIEIEGTQDLHVVEHTVMNDRLEAGALLLAAAVTGGSITLPDAPAYALDIVLQKLQDMGHAIDAGLHGIGVTLRATENPRAISFKTGPYPGFPTDLQAPMMAAQIVADGVSIIEETVYENRFLHVSELQKMGADIVIEHNRAVVKGVNKILGASVVASDIRASCALMLAGLVADGKTIMSGMYHWQRAYDKLEEKLQRLGAHIELVHKVIIPQYYRHQHQNNQWYHESNAF